MALWWRWQAGGSVVGSGGVCVAVRSAQEGWASVRQGHAGAMRRQ